MTIPVGLAAGLGFLPNWLCETQDIPTLESLFNGWVQCSGWHSAGLVCPIDSSSELSLRARPDGIDLMADPPPDLDDVVNGLRSGTGMVVWKNPYSGSRLYCLLTPPSRHEGVLWIERETADSWSDAERNYLRLSARLIERSPALATHVGPKIDPERLQQRLVDASVIAGRMAHDFDNILTGIIGFADLSAKQLPEGSQVKNFVTEISQVGQRGIQFTKQLHQLSRAGQCKPHSGNVSVVVAKEIARLSPGLAAGAEILTNVPANLSAVGMEDGSLSVVIGHLLGNATEATPPGGRVTVSARVVDLSMTESRSYLGQVSPGPHVEVTIQDSGPGIRPEIRAKLFAEPFHTTKVRHRGLGLAIVYRTLYAHRGGVRLDSAPLPVTGTIARVVIPPAVVRSAVATPVVASTPILGG